MYCVNWRALPLVTLAEEVRVATALPYDGLWRCVDVTVVDLLQAAGDTEPIESLVVVVARRCHLTVLNQR